MSSTNSSSRTEPKGRATRSRNSRQSTSRVGPKLQWIVLVVVALAIVGFVLYLGRDVRSTIGFIGAATTAIVDVGPLSGT